MHFAQLRETCERPVLDWFFDFSAPDFTLACYTLCEVAEPKKKNDHCNTANDCPRYIRASSHNVTKDATVNQKELQRNHRITQSSIEWFLHVGYHYGTLTESKARQLAAVNRTTFDRWSRGESSAPSATLELLRLHAFGEPPLASKAWRGFRFQNDFLTIDDAYTYTADDVRALWNWRRLAHEYLQLMNAGRIMPAPHPSTKSA